MDNNQFQRVYRILRQYAVAKREDPMLRTYTQRYIVEKRARLRS